MQVAVYDKRTERITVVPGEGIIGVKCHLTPIRTGQSYASSVYAAKCGYPIRPASPVTTCEPRRNGMLLPDNRWRAHVK